MFWILSWVLYGLIVGLLTKAIYPGDNEPKGFLATVGIGVIGSFVGGILNWIMGITGSPLQPAGWVMGVLGGLTFCWIYLRFIEPKLKKEE